MTGERTHRVRPDVQATARRLRRPQTPAEARLWAHLRGQQVDGLKFRRQHPIGRFITDFYCATAHLIVELDGESHEDRQEYDTERTAWLTAQGYRVIRFTNEDVHQRLEMVLQTIWQVCRRG